MDRVALDSQPASDTLSGKHLLYPDELLLRRVSGSPQSGYRAVVGNHHPSPVAASILLAYGFVSGIHGRTMPAESSKGQPRPDFSDVPAARRRNMAAIRSRDTKPEMTVRRALHAMGFRFQLHRRDLPGTPDIVLPRWKTVVQVHGCQWHAHEGCSKFRLPATRKDWWKAKLEGNVARDLRNQAALEAAGWFVIVAWECDIRADPARVTEQIAKTIRNHRTSPPRQDAGTLPT